MQQVGSCALIYFVIALRSSMSGILWEFLAFIYIKAYGLIVRDIMPSYLACLGRRVLVPEDILGSIVTASSAHAG
jgi:hypothetical protein